MMLEPDELEQKNSTDGGWAFLIGAIPFVLSLCGIMMLASLSQRNYTGAGSMYAMPIKQAVYLVLGIVTMFFTSALSIRFVRSKGWILWLVSCFLLYLTLVPGIGIMVGGARRWLSLGFMRFQPLEFLLFALPIFLADRLNVKDTRPHKGLGAIIKPFTPTVTIIACSCLPMALHHMGGSLLVVAICLLMHAENRGWKYPSRVLILCAMSGVGLILIAPYRMRRFQSFLDPWADPQGKGYQIIQGLIAFANGGLHGLGIGKGLQEARYLPAAQTDYIFAAFGEEFGLVGTLTLLSLYALWTWRMYKVYTGLKDPFLSSLTIGMTASVICPMFINLAGVMHLLPLTGIPMPFLSMGGSAMLFMWAKVGILITISSYSFGPRANYDPDTLALPSHSNSHSHSRLLPRPAKVKLPVQLPESIEPQHDREARLRRRRTYNTGEIIMTLPSSENRRPRPSTDYNNNRNNNRPGTRPGRRTGRGGRNA